MAADSLHPNLIEISDVARVDGGLPITSLPEELLLLIFEHCPELRRAGNEAVPISINDVLVRLAERGLASLVVEAMPFSNPEHDRSAAIRRAARHGRADCVKALLSANPPYEHLASPLADAADLGHLECAALLAPRVPALECRAALAAAAGSGHVELLSMLIDRLSTPDGGQPCFSDSLLSLLELGYTQALQEAALYGHVECARILAPLSNPMLDDSLALRWAANIGSSEIVELLIPRSDPSAHNWTALTWAIDSGRDSCVNLLLPLFEPSDQIPDLMALARIAQGDKMDTAASFLIAHAEAEAIAKSALASPEAPPQGKLRL